MSQTSQFLQWHVIFTSTNNVIHTLQYQEGVRAMCVAEKGGYVYSHPYDLGAYENLISVRDHSSFFVSFRTVLLSSLMITFKSSTFSFYRHINLSCFAIEFQLRHTYFIALMFNFYQICFPWQFRFQVQMSFAGHSPPQDILVLAFVFGQDLMTYLGRQHQNECF